ncbi:hypothetical protein ACFL07_00360 [Pseudomonadota bacterium]
MSKLVKCKACGEAVSKNAPACPKCGEPLKQQRKSVGCGSAIVLIVFALIFVGIVSDRGDETPKKPLTASELRKQKIESQFSAWDGAHQHLEKLVEANLKDPDSYEHIKTTYRDKGDAILVVMNYRAKNSFGGYVVNRIIATYDINGNLTLGPFDCNETPDLELCR